MVETEGGYLYDTASVDMWLATVARNFVTTPTVDNLAAGRVVLLSTQEVADLLGYGSTGSVTRAWRQGRIGGLNVGYIYRYDLQTVREQMELASGKPLLFAEVLHVLGVSTLTLDRLRREGRLSTVSVGCWPHVTRDSLKKLLRELLPEWLDPDAWIEDRLACPLPLMAIYSVAWSHHDTSRISRLLDARELNYVCTPHDMRGHQYMPAGPYRLIAPESWLAYVMRTEEVMSDTNIAAQFGITTAAVRQWHWNHPEWLRCRVHDHPDDDLYPTCMIFLLKSLLPGKASAAKWYHSRLKGAPLLKTEEAAALLGVSPRRLLKMARTGEVLGLSTPGGKWVFSRPALVTWKQRHKQ